MRSGSFGRHKERSGQPRTRLSWKMRLIPLILFAIYGLYYYASHQENVPLTGRSHLVDMTREQEMALGLQAYQEILSQSRVIPEGQFVDLTRTIGRRLAQAAADVDPGFEWEFNVIESPQANAFALPGGKTAVYTGLLSVAENHSGLAVIMGHEIAHAIARHGAERMAQQTVSPDRHNGSRDGLERHGSRHTENGHERLGSQRTLWGPSPVFARA